MKQNNTWNFQSLNEKEWLSRKNHDLCACNQAQKN